MKQQVYPYWRPAREMVAAAGWAGCAVVYWFAAHWFWYDQPAWAPLWLMGVVFAAVRFAQGIAHWHRKARLTCLPDLEMDAKELERKLKAARRRARWGRLRIN